MFGLVAICIRMRGPLFVSVFNPLLLIIVAIIGSLVLDEKLHLGRYVILTKIHHLHNKYFLKKNIVLNILFPK